MACSLPLLPSKRMDYVCDYDTSHIALSSSLANVDLFNICISKERAVKSKENIEQVNVIKV